MSVFYFFHFFLFFSNHCYESWLQPFVWGGGRGGSPLRLKERKKRNRSSRERKKEKCAALRCVSERHSRLNLPKSTSRTWLICTSAALSVTRGRQTSLVWGGVGGQQHQQQQRQQQNKLQGFQSAPRCCYLLVGGCACARHFDWGRDIKPASVCMHGAPAQQQTSNTHSDAVQSCLCKHFSTNLTQYFHI